MPARALLNIVYQLVTENMEEKDRIDFDGYLHATEEDMKQDRLAAIYDFGGEVEHVN